MTIQQRIFPKIIGQSCDGVKFKGFHAPCDAVTYDRVRGVSKKGQFDIVTFWDKDKYLTKRVTKIVDKKGNETIKIKKWSKFDDIVTEAIAINGKVKEFITKTLNFDHDKGVFSCVTERLVNTKKGTRDFHEFALFEKGKKPKKMAYEALWDGNAPKIHYTNVSARMPKEGLEYMPLLVSKGTQARHRHLSLINLRKYGLEGVGHEAERIKFTELNPQYKSYKDVPDDESVDLISGLTEFEPQSGCVFISDHVKDAEELIGVYGHEYKHVDDISHVLRLKFVADGWKSLSKEDLKYIKNTEPQMYKFVTGSMKKGIIKKHGKNHEKYRYYKWLEKFFDFKKYNKQVKTIEDQQHHPVEVGLIRESKKEVEKFNFLKDNIFDVLHSD